MWCLLIVAPLRLRKMRKLWNVAEQLVQKMILEMMPEMMLMRKVIPNPAQEPLKILRTGKMQQFGCADR